MTNKEKVQEKLPRATAVHDYNHESAWCHIHEDHDEDGLGVGEIIGFGGPGDEDGAWKDAAEHLGIA